MKMIFTIQHKMSFRTNVQQIHLTLTLKIPQGLCDNKNYQHRLYVQKEKSKLEQKMINAQK